MVLCFFFERKNGNFVTEAGGGFLLVLERPDGTY